MVPEHFGGILFPGTQEGYEKAVSLRKRLSNKRFNQYPELHILQEK
jgi:hypothetical protein